MTKSSLSLNWVSAIPVPVSSLEITSVRVKLYRVKEGMEGVSHLEQKTILPGDPVPVPVLITDFAKTMDVCYGKNYETGAPYHHHWARVLLARNRQNPKRRAQSDDVIRWPEETVFLSQLILVADLSFDFSIFDF